VSNKMKIARAAFAFAYERFEEAWKRACRYADDPINEALALNNLSDACSNLRISAEMVSEALIEAAMKEQPK
jgi:hypothetical protein